MALQFDPDWPDELPREWDIEDDPGTEELRHLPVPLDPRLLAARPGISAEERGWVVETDDEVEAQRERAERQLTSIERHVQVMKLYHRGVSTVDIAELQGLTMAQVNALIHSSQRKALRRVGAQKEREAQIHLTGAVLNRLAERVFPDADPDGRTMPVDLKAVDTMIKVLNRRAALTGADAPNRLTIDGEIVHTPAMEVVEKVNEYMDLADQLVQMGYGSGRLPEGSGSDIIDAEIVDPRALPPPEPPVAPWKKIGDHDEDLVAQSTPKDPEAVTVEAPDPDPKIRALRPPEPTPIGAKSGVAWSVNEDDYADDDPYPQRF